MHKLTPFLWYNGKIDEAVALYTSVFGNSKVLSSSPGPGGALMSATLEIEGQQLILFNGGPGHKLSPAVSLYVNCESQEEIDYFWEKLSEGGEKSQCGWLKDKYGLSWQVWPGVIGDFLAGDPEGSNRVMQEVMKMQKLEIEPLQRAYEGRG